MLIRNKIKLIKSLDKKSAREETGLFLAEGDKIVREIISSDLQVNFIAGTEDWFLQNNNLVTGYNCEKITATKDEIIKASLLKNPQNVLCVAEIPHNKFNLTDLNNKLSIILDNVQDPGNLGTIIRIADWFGIEHIICSNDCADIYNPKVIQSTMGAIIRIKAHYKELSTLLRDIINNEMFLFGTSLHGENIYSTQLPANGLIILGNESKGINPEFEKYFTKNLFIPYFPANQKRSESLNVAVAAAIICSEFRRRL